MRRRLLGYLVSGAAVLSAGCGGAAPAPNCPMVSTSCPSPEPSYANDVAPIIQQRCALGCHSPTGIEPTRPYQTYDEVTGPNRQIQIDILLQVRDCRMPRAGSPPLSVDELTTLLGWLYCDAPNN
jgi:hypothetical protein